MVQFPEQQYVRQNFDRFIKDLDWEISNTMFFDERVITASRICNHKKPSIPFDKMDDVAWIHDNDGFLLSGWDFYFDMLFPIRLEPDLLVELVEAYNKARPHIKLSFTDYRLDQCKYSFMAKLDLVEEYKRRDPQKWGLQKG